MVDGAALIHPTRVVVWAVVVLSLLAIHGAGFRSIPGQNDDRLNSHSFFIDLRALRGESRPESSSKVYPDV